MLPGVGGGAAQGRVCPSPKDTVQLDTVTVDLYLTCHELPSMFRLVLCSAGFFPEDQVEPGRGGKVETEMEGVLSGVNM